MSIASIKLDEKTTLDFGVSITGADGRPEARFIIERGNNFSVSFPCRQTNEGMSVDIYGLKEVFKAGEYSARLEIVLENKLYVPLQDKIEFEPTVTVSTQTKPIVRESIKVAKVTVKKSELTEDQLRKTQAATIIANALGYKPYGNETPEAIVNSALANTPSLTAEQAETVADMLQLAEECGIEYNKDF